MGEECMGSSEDMFLERGTPEMNWQYCWERIKCSLCMVQIGRREWDKYAESERGGDSPLPCPAIHLAGNG